MPKKAQQSDNYKFSVSQESLIHNGKPTGFFGNFRTDTGDCLGVTSEQYGLLQNETLLEAAYTALDKQGLSGYDERIVVAGKGERLYARFTFKEKQLASQVGDVFGYELTLKNSFDRTMRASLALGFLRLTCLNGASTLEKEFSVAQIHSSGINTDFLGDAITRAIASGEKALAVFDELAKVSISDEQGQFVLRHLEKANALSGRLRQPIETLWLAPKRDEDKARNMYNLYNAVTEHLTHNVSKDRFEYADKVNNAILIKLVNAVRNANQFDKLTMPITEAESI